MSPAPSLPVIDHPEVCVGAIALSGDQLLLIRRGHGPAGGLWSLPGGRVQLGETTAEAVVRELAEETGLEVMCDEFVGWVERIGEGFHFLILDFNVTVISTDPPVAGDDAAEVMWVPVSHLASFALVDGLAEFLHEHGIMPAFA
jgi:ADP-ribose pyrophosphatase YjhB (NUDIX family)